MTVGLHPGRVAAFLRDAGWDGARRTPLAGDASGRRYARLTGPGRSAVLMETPIDATASTRAFVAVAGRLAAIGLSPPRILAARAEEGLLLLEDLGDELLARIAQAEPAAEPALYAAAADVLVALRAAPTGGLPLYDAAAMAEATTLAATCYAGRADAPWLAPLHAALEAHAGPADTMILRDYHAENLVWRPEQRGAARMGLLDFQDAMRGAAAYDLASLIRDARRDVSPEAAETATARFALRIGADRDRLDAALAVLGAQRNLRLLGIFARLGARGRPHYRGFLPRVWAQLTADLAHPACAAVRAPALAALAPPVAPERAAAR